MAKKPATTATETPSTSAKEYMANWTIDNIDGEVYEAGDIVTLDPEKAKPFLELKALSEIRGGAAVAASDDGDESQEGNEPPEGSIP